MLTRTISPTALISVETIKRHLRIRTDDDNALLADLEQQAVGYFDGHAGILGKAILSQTWEQTFRQFDTRMRLGLGPLRLVTEIKYFDRDGTEQTLAAGQFFPQRDGLGPYLQFKPEFSAPTVYDRDDAIKIVFEAGYGTSAADVPAPIISAVLWLIGTLYNNDSHIQVDETFELPFSIADLVAPFRKIM